MQYLGFIGMAETLAKSSLFISIGIGIFVAKECGSSKQDGPTLTEAQKAELDAFRRAEEWRKG